MVMKDFVEQVGLIVMLCIECVWCMECDGVIIGYYVWVDLGQLGVVLLVFVEIMFGYKGGNMFE